MSSGASGVGQSGLVPLQNVFEPAAGTNGQIDNQKEIQELRDLLEQAGFSQDQIEEIMTEVANRIEANQPVDQASLAEIVGHQSPITE